MMNKAGDCLKYSLTVELPTRKTIENGKKHIMAFLNYFSLMGYIDKKSYIRLLGYISVRNLTVAEKKKLYYPILETITRCLGRFYDASNSMELIKKLNSIEIPGWVFDNEKLLSMLAPDARILDDALFFLLDDIEGKLLYCIDVGELCRFRDPEDVIELKAKLSENVISNGFTEILGIDPIDKILYMEVSRDKKTYVEIHIENEEMVVHNRRCFGVVYDNEGRACPIVEKNRSLVIIKNGEEIILERINRLFTYSVIAGNVRVCSRDGGPSFIKPYDIGVDGKKSNLSYREYARIILNEIWKDINQPTVNLLLRHNRNITKPSYPTDDGSVLSISVLSPFITHAQKDTELTVKVYQRILRAIGECKNREDDILDLLYLFADISKKMVKDLNSKDGTQLFSFTFFHRLTDLGCTGELSKCIDDRDKLVEAFDNDIYWTEERIDTFLMMEEDSKIGVFDITDKGVEFVKCSTQKGVILGDLIIMNPKSMDEKYMNYSGRVSYNMFNSKYFIQYDRMLSENEKKQVLEQFEITDSYDFLTVDNCG